jgi:hypothetical protein
MKKNQAEVIRRIQEIRKFDEATINQAIEVCQDNMGRYSMDQVLNILMDEEASKSMNNSNNNSGTTCPSTSPSTRSDNNNNNNNNNNSNNNTNSNQSHRSSNNTTNKKTTANNTNENNRSPSNQSYQNSNEYPIDIYGNRVTNLDDDDDDEYDGLLASNNSQNSSNTAMIDSQRMNLNGLTEANLLREANKPSGLINIGNTCWFNSIIQAFFHLPYFRQLILSFQVDQNDLNNKMSENSRNVVLFICELRKLFGFMLKSKRKAINPSLTLRYLRNCSKFDVDNFNQEDVSEFATILVNLIEEGFDILYKLQNTLPSPNSCSFNNNNNQTGSLSSSLASSSTTITSDSGNNNYNSSNLVQLNDFDSVSSIINQATKENNIDALTQGLSSFNFQLPSMPPIEKLTNEIFLKNQQLKEQQDQQTATTTTKSRKNPIVNILNGNQLIIRKNTFEDVENSMSEVFREINIQMLNSRNLHAGLELEWGETSIDKLTSSSNKTSNLPTSTNDSKANNTIEVT